MKKSTFVLDLDDLQDLQDIKDAEVGKLLKAILIYAETGQVLKLPPRAGVIFGFIRRRLDRDRKKYEDVCQKRAEAGKLGAEKTNRLRAANAALRTANSPERDPEPEPDREPDPDPDREPEPEREPVGQGPGKPPAEKTENVCLGSYGWIRLSREEYQALCQEMTREDLQWCIDYVDELAQSTGNKNRWKDWALVLRRCHREGWGLRNRQEKVPMGATGQLGQAELDAIRRTLRE